MRMRAPARTSRFLLFALLNDLVFGMIGDEGGGNVVGEVGSSSVWNTTLHLRLGGPLSRTRSCVIKKTTTVAGATWACYVPVTWDQRGNVS